MKGAWVGGCCALALVVATAARAIVIGGGGSASTDCLVALSVDANYPVSDPRQVRCIDGDPACDNDGVVNGVCDLRVSLCANSTFDPTLHAERTRVRHHRARARQRRSEVRSRLPVATEPRQLRLHVPGDRLRLHDDRSHPRRHQGTASASSNACGRQKKKLKLRALSTSGPNGIKEDKDTLKLYCDPAPPTPWIRARIDHCDPQTLFSGTFDRVQRQIFNQNCAVSGCHDSQSQSGGPAARDRRVVQQPRQPRAGELLGARPPAGCASTSSLTSAAISRPASSFHKIEGDLPDPSYGERMPRHRGKLHATLRDLIELWIQAGAPQTGWVPGTF